jgi:hypothetical protein
MKRVDPACVFPPALAYTTDSCAIGVSWHGTAASVQGWNPLLSPQISQCWRTGSSKQLSREIQLGVFLIMRENMVGRGERGGRRQCELSCSSSSCGCQTDRETCVSSRVLGGGSFGGGCKLSRPWVSCEKAW